MATMVKALGMFDLGEMSDALDIMQRPRMMFKSAEYHEAAKLVRSLPELDGGDLSQWPDEFKPGGKWASADSEDAYRERDPYCFGVAAGGPVGAKQKYRGDRLLFRALAEGLPWDSGVSWSSTSWAAQGQSLSVSKFSGAERFTVWAGLVPSAAIRGRLVWSSPTWEPRSAVVDTPHGSGLFERVVDDEWFVDPSRVPADRVWPMFTGPIAAGVLVPYPTQLDAVGREWPAWPD